MDTNVPGVHNEDFAGHAGAAYDCTELE
jgi:hypothetical protein